MVDLPFVFYLVPDRNLVEAIRLTKKITRELFPNFPSAPTEVLLAVNDRGEKEEVSGSLKLAGSPTFEDMHKHAWISTIGLIFVYNVEKGIAIVEELKDKPLDNWAPKLISKLLNLVQEEYEELTPKLLTGENVLTGSKTRMQYVIALEVLLEIQATGGVPPFAYIRASRPIPLNPYNWVCYDLSSMVLTIPNGKSIVAMRYVF